MTAILLFALFAAIVSASALTLVDAALRGRTAVRRLRGDLARLELARQVSVRFADEAAVASAPRSAQRVSVKRRATRQPVRAVQPRRAAA